MIVDGIGVEALGDGRVTKTAVLHSEARGSTPMHVVVPAELAPPAPDDATGTLPLALLVAMRLGEDLEIRGRVDGELLARTDDIQDYLVACGAGRLRRAAIRTAGRLAPDGVPSPLAATCLSRGVDSLYQAARRRSAGGELDALLFVDRFEPIHDDGVRAQERTLAREAADEIGLPLVIVEAPLREVTDPLFDWEDAVGAGLACVAHAVAGGFGRLVIPASDTLPTLGPCGVGPALDPLLSSRRMRLEAGDVSQTRVAKVAWLARWRPELLPLLKVCYSANRSDNCGRCGKCLHTMACLRVSGVLDRATGFPPELDLDALATDEPSGALSILVEMAAVRDAAERVGDAPVAAAVTEYLRRCSLSRWPGGPAERPSFRGLGSVAIRDLLKDDAPARPAGPGLVRAIDLRGRRHVHGAGWRPAGAITAELGALAPHGDVALWVLPDGRLATAEVRPRGARGGRARRFLHALAPLGGRGGARRAARRVLDLALVQPHGAAAAPEGPPQGLLHAAPGADRIPLWAGEHPITGDQYTAASAAEVQAAGYADPRLLGYLEARAPLTGGLGVHATPIIPWA